VTTQLLVESPISGERRLPLRGASIARLARYGATSVVAFAISEITLLVLYGLNVTGATTAAVLANLAGTVPSYLMSRYWIWSEAPRARVGRQVAMYWLTSIICIAGTSLATGAIASLAPSGHRFHLAVAGLGFLLVNIVFWFAKFEVYQRIIFPVNTRGANASLASSNHEPDGMVAVEPVS
jgi:putative flippase GtrA